jgi:hypothetical protein
MTRPVTVFPSAAEWTACTRLPSGELMEPQLMHVHGSKSL